jgi:hypothetical protein
MDRDQAVNRKTTETGKVYNLFFGPPVDGTTAHPQFRFLKGEPDRSKNPRPKLAAFGCL